MRWWWILLLLGCGEESRYDPETHWEEGELGVWRPGLTVAEAGGCSTGIVAGLSRQLIAEINCMRPNTLSDFSGAGVAAGGNVFPFLQPGGTRGLRAAVAARGRNMQVNSALRTLAQQYLLYRWYQAGQCGIGLAARPGRSNHESGLAIDIEDNAGWRNALEAQSFRWFGGDDPVHFDYRGGGTVELAGLSILAFQRLWNRNHPEDVIDEDGLYGPQTEARLRASPTDGFDVGACEPEPEPEPEPDAEVPDAEVPDAEVPPEAPDAALPPLDFAVPPPPVDAGTKPPELPDAAVEWGVPPEAPDGDLPLPPDRGVQVPDLPSDFEEDFDAAEGSGARLVGSAGCAQGPGGSGLWWLLLLQPFTRRGRQRWRAALRSRRQAGSSK